MVAAAVKDDRDRFAGLCLAGFGWVIVGDFDRGFDGAFNGEGATNSHDVFVDFGAIDEDFFSGWFVVGDAFKGDVGNESADFFAFFVLFAFINEAIGGGVLIVQFVPRKGCG